jgi:hypothetical protein
LSDAGLISGVSGTAATFGSGLPNAKIPGGLVVANMTTAPYTGLTITHLATAANPSAAAGGNGLTPSQAAQIDRKMDDGQSQTGTVIGYGLAGSCVSAAGNGYLESTTTKDCAISWRIQQ